MKICAGECAGEEEGPQHAEGAPPHGQQQEHTPPGKVHQLLSGHAGICSPAGYPNTSLLIVLPAHTISGFIHTAIKSFLILLDMSFSTTKVPM